MDWLLHFDQSIFRAIHVGMHSRWLDPVFLVLSYSGLGQVQFLACLLFLLRRDTKYYVFPLLVTILVAGLPVAQGIKKLLVERERPSMMWVAKPQEWIFGNSFPSGHTTTSFAIAAMLILLTWKTPRAWIGWISLVWAVLVAVSRVYRGIHWPTDVMGGACAGVASACLVFLVLRKLGRQLEAPLAG